jgi:exosome complex RNA-binding protein Rrp4
MEQVNDALKLLAQAKNKLNLLVSANGHIFLEEAKEAQNLIEEAIGKLSNCST